MPKIVNFLFIILWISLVVGNPGDYLWGSCQNVNIVNQNKYVCITLVEDADCGAKVTLTVDSNTVFEQDLDLEVAPQVCGRYSGCNFCAKLLPDASNNTCISVEPTCFITLPPIAFGCLTSDVLQKLQNCLATRCPNDCSGHGTCLNGTCQCANGYFGKDCSSSAPVFETCRKVGPLDANVCVRLQYLQCKINVTIRLQSGPAEYTVFEQSYPLNNFKALFAQDMCALNARNCQICLDWNQLNINPGHDVSGCGSMNVTCFNQQFGNFDLGCFTDDVVLPECFLQCDNHCSGHGDCEMGKCICTPPYSGPDCSQAITTGTSTTSSNSANTNPNDPDLPTGLVVGMILFVVIGIAAVVVGVAWFLKRKRNQQMPQFKPLEIEEDSLIAGEEDNDKL